MGKSSKFKGVIQSFSSGKYKVWVCQISIDGVKKKKCMPIGSSERDAAKWVDLQLIRSGKSPVNVLKPV